MSKKKKKEVVEVVEEEILETKEPEIIEEPEVIEEPIEEKEDEIIIEEPLEEEVPIEETIEISEDKINVGDFVIVKDAEEKHIYKVKEIHGNMVILKYHGLESIKDIADLIKVK